MIIIRRGIIPPASVAAATTTWNPSDKGAPITLSNGNLTITGGTAEAGIRAIASHSTGKYYFETTVTNDRPNANFEIGIANISWARGTTFLGEDSNGIGWARDGNIYLSGANVGPGSFTWSGGSVLQVAVDFGNSKIWFRKDAGLWNLGGSDDPATNTGGISIAGMAAGPYYPGARDGGDVVDQNVVTSNFGATTYAQTAPSGFSNW